MSILFVCVAINPAVTTLYVNSLTPTSAGPVFNTLYHGFTEIFWRIHIARLLSIWKRRLLLHDLLLIDLIQLS